MLRRLKCAIVDGDAFVASMIKKLCMNSEIAEITHSFNCAKQFLSSLNSLKIDVCMLEISMHGIDGLAVSQLLEGIPYIFITDNDSLLREALNKNPIDIITKPINSERLLWVLDKTYKQVIGNSQYEDSALFNVAEAADRVKINLEDILYVETSVKNPRNKVITLRNGKKYTLMDYTYEKLLFLCKKLEQVNRRTLVSVEAVQQVRHNAVTINIKGSNREIVLSDKCRKKIMLRIPKL
jgi:DNA-binding LytR/AlgR family response regulator